MQHKYQEKAKIQVIKWIKTLFVALLLFSGLAAKAQVYPVQVIPQITPPYNVTLSSYTTTTSDKINVRLILTDINQNNLDVRLKMIIRGQGLNIQSRDFVVGAAPINLTGGVQTVLSNFDLSPYFQLNNLIGINPQQYNRPLPDGRYEICFQVITTNTNNPQLVSNPNMGCVFPFIVINDPPFLNLPQRNEQITLKDPLNILFQWTPRHLNATNVSYEFELRELWDTQIDPQAGFLASPPLYTQTTFSTTLLYDPSKPALLPDKTYAWRVRAISTSGISENAIFRNNGYSEIYHFNLTADCDPPTFPLSEAISPSTVKIRWQESPKHNKYHVQYKKANVDDAEWFEVFTYNNQAQISNLEAGITYDFRVGGTCNSLTQLEQSYTYTSINQFTMPTEDEAVSYNCGVAPNIEITNQTPLQNLGVNETFYAGDFPVTVKEIQNNGGRFTGNGFITVPYLADTKIAVGFEGITINTEYQLIEGVVQTTYDPNWGDVVSIDGFIDGIIDLISDIQDSLSNGETLTEEEVEEAGEQAEGYYDSMNSQIDALVEEGLLTESAAEDLKQTLQESEEAFDNSLLASTDDSTISQAMEASETAEEKLQEVQNAINAATNNENTVAPTDPLARIITALSNSGDLGAIKCKKCDEEVQPLDSNIIITISGENYSCLVAKLLSNGIEFLSSNNLPENASSDIAPYYNLIKDEIIGKDDVLYLFNQQGELTDCNVIYPLPETFCNNPIPNTEIETHLTEEIEQCVNDILNDVQQKLLALKQSFRNNQQAQFVRNGNVYKLNTNDEVEVIENALTDAQIENGEWTDDAIDQIFRVYENENGILQFTAVGIRGNLPIFDGKTADLQSLSQNMKDKGNAFLESFSVANINDTPQQKGATLDSDDFADGEQINIDEGANFFRIISEAGGKMGTLLKTGEIEESTYLSTTKTTEVIHAPPVVTGSTEAATRAVTDITGVVVLVYDLGTDAEARQQTWQGLKQVKDQVVENPSTLFPLLTDIIVEEATGNTPEDWAEISNEGTDSGRKGHLTTKGAVRTTVTIFASGKLLLKLPDMAAELSLKLLRSKLFKQMDDLGWDEVLKDAFKADFDDAANIDFKELFEQADEIRQTELLKSWETVRDAIPNQSGTTQFALDPNTINKVADYLSPDNASKLDAIGGVDELKSFITKHPDVPCSTCNGGGLPVFGSRTMDEMIENFVEVGHIFKDHPDLWQKLKIGTESANAAMREGTQHTLKVFKDNPSKYAPDNIADLDMKFESVLDDICVNCRFDVKFTNEALSNTIPKFAEFKSYNSNTWANIKNSPKFIRQFKRYLQDPDVSNLNNLQYIVNTSKAPLSEIKTAFKEMMTSKKDDIFEAMNDNLKNSLSIEFVSDIDNDLIDEMIEIFVKSN